MATQPTSAAPNAPVSMARAKAKARIRSWVWWNRFSRPRVTLDVDGSAQIEQDVDLRLSDSAVLKIEKGVVVRKHSELKVEGACRIGSNTFIGRFCTLCCRDSINIGEDCLIAESISIRDHDHNFSGDLDIPINSQGFVDSPISIGNNVWIGAKVTITKGVTIGDNSVIGAHSVVTHDIPANSVRPR